MSTSVVEPATETQRTTDGAAGVFQGHSAWAAQNILAQAQEERFVIEDFKPLADSLEWDLGQRYLRERGSMCFIGDTNPVPFAVNNDGLLSRQAADTFFHSLVEAERAGPLEPQIYVLELGIGVGLFARFFLDSFQEICAQHGKDYYHRLVYVAGDRSEQMLADACRHGIFANHPGRYLIRVVDAMRLQIADLGLQIENQHGGQGAGARPLRAVFLNYLLDCLPAADLKIVDGEVRQLCVRTCLARNVDLAEYTQLAPQDLARRACSWSVQDRRVLLELYGLLASEYDYRPLESGGRGSAVGTGNGQRTTDDGQLPYLDFAVQFARAHTSHLLHSYGAIQSLEGLLSLLHPQGFILINDYGQTQLAETGDFEHQRFSHATFVGLNFPLLKAYFSGERSAVSGERSAVRDRQSAEQSHTAEAESRSLRADSCQWVEPLEDNGRIHSRLLGHAVGAEAARFFAERFSKAAGDWLQEPWNAARANLQAGRIEAALTAYHQALDRQPNNWILLNEIALFLIFTLRNPPAGIALAKVALDLNPACSAELWNTLGDGYYEIGKIPEAKNAYRRALRVNPADVKARYNLTWVLLHERRYHAALSLVAEALALDETGEYYERLVKKQGEILGRLAQRNQQKFFLLANRVSNKAANGKKTELPTK